MIPISGNLHEVLKAHRSGQKQSEPDDLLFRTPSIALDPTATRIVAFVHSHAPAGDVCECIGQVSRHGRAGTTALGSRRSRHR